MTFVPKRIAITGASRGIGAALAKAYAEPGATLHLAARNAEKTELVAQECRDMGANVETIALDVTDFDEVRAWVENMPSLDLFIANAGISGGTASPGLLEPQDQIEKLHQVNYLASAHSINVAAEKMRNQGYGHIAAIGSVQALNGAPQSPAYCASKAALRIYVQSARALFRPSGVSFSYFMPGFVDTDMSRRYQGPRPLLISAEKAAKIVKKSISKKVPEKVFPFPLPLMPLFLNLLPAHLADRILLGQKFGVAPE